MTEHCGDRAMLYDASGDDRVPESGERNQERKLSKKGQHMFLYAGVRGGATRHAVSKQHTRNSESMIVVEVSHGEELDSSWVDNSALRGNDAYNGHTILSIFHMESGVIESR
jgi:hypothetical protein